MSNYNSINISSAPFITNISNISHSPCITNTSGTFIQGWHTTASAVISLTNNLGKEIVRLNQDGSVTWAAGINIDESAEAFAKSLSYGAELKIGLTDTVKRRLRDEVFETIIGFAKEKGALSSDDLTYLLESSKIIEKLKV